jgi:hypothetical protein
MGTPPEPAPEPAPRYVRWVVGKGPDRKVFKVAIVPKRGRRHTVRPEQQED